MDFLRHLNSECRKFYHARQNVGLVMNEMKTEVLYQSSNGQLEPQIHVGGVVLKNGKKLQYLGGIVQNDAKMDNYP